MQALSVSNSHDFSTIAVGGGARCEKKDVFFLSCSHIILASSARLIISQRQSTLNRWCTKSSRCSSQPRTRRPSSACNTTPALSAYDRAELGQSVLALRTASDTNNESGFVAAMAAFDNRLIFLTNTRPNQSRRYVHSLLGMVRATAIAQGTPAHLQCLRGLGVDFDAALIDANSVARSCNYRSRVRCRNRRAH